MEPQILERAQHPISRRDIDPNVLKVLYRLIGAGHAAYLVGGGVRDLMMGRRPKDFDVATSAHPHQVRELFRNSRLIGRRFRLVHVFFGAQNIEVATFRRHSEEIPVADDPLIRQDNTFGTAEEDAFRRDFTVNALFYDPGTFHVIDYTNGVSDLHGRLIRTVGDPELRMREDPVRMIRAVRFAIKLGFAIEPATRAAMERHRGDLVKAAIPRLAEETYRTLTIAGADRALILFEQLGILELLLPFIAEELAHANLEEAPAVCNLAAASRLIGAGQELSRPLILACVFAARHLARAPELAGDNRFELVEALRARGFSKADTEHMRLLLEALTHMVERTRQLRRLLRRPYFAEARSLYELIAPSAANSLDDFLTGPPRPQPASGSTRRRRRHRGGRGRRSGALRAPLAATAVESDAAGPVDGAAPASTAAAERTESSSVAEGIKRTETH